MPLLEWKLHFLFFSSNSIFFLFLARCMNNLPKSKNKKGTQMFSVNVKYVIWFWASYLSSHSRVTGFLVQSKSDFWLDNWVDSDELINFLYKVQTSKMFLLFDDLIFFGLVTELTRPSYWFWAWQLQDLPHGKFCIPSRDWSGFNFHIGKKSFRWKIYGLSQ